MQSKPSPTLRSKSAIFTAFCLISVLPSCAFKRLTNHSDAATNAAALEEALAILDKAIEETAPASEISSLPLEIPIHPETSDPPPTDDPNSIPLIETVSSESDEDLKTLETLFAVETEESAAVEEPTKPETELETPRERVVVHRPAPNYHSHTETTPALDEFRKVRTTAYSHTEADHIKYGELSAMGKPLRFGMVRSAAADWSRYPVGTRFRIVGKPYEYVIDDYGSALVGTDTIDLYKPSDDRMDEWGVREVEIEVIAWGSFAKSVEILEPRKEFGEHVSQMLAAISEEKPTNNAIVAGGNDASIRPF